MKLTKRKRTLLIVVIVGITLCLVACPYARIWKLNSVARRSSGGSMGCGVGTVTLHTSSGPVKIQTGLDPIHVFGKEIRVSELVNLVKRRARCHGQGLSPTAGNLGSLYYVILSTLGESGDETVIQPISLLLDDPNEVISAWAALALIRLGEQNEQLRDAIKSTEFPETALLGARNRGVEPPTWLGLNDNGPSTTEPSLPSEGAPSDVQ